MSAEPEIHFEMRGSAGLVTLNRPKALNALTLNMVREMHPRLLAWAEDDRIDRVIVRAAGDRAFCAGGDVRRLYDWGLAGDPRAVGFYREEYRLDTLIKRYPKPYIALIDGIVMGGGVGLSVHGGYRVGGPRTVFAMPETGIGMFPDVGGTYFLPRLPGALGAWLALTGARMKQADALRAGVLTHAVAAEDLEALAEALCAGGEVAGTLNAFAGDPGSGEAAAPRTVIDRCFSADSVEEIIERLDAETGAHADWARETAATIRTKSPTSLGIALRQMREGAARDFEDCMRTEFRIVNRIVAGHDFYEGVRAVIVDKDNRPRWDPARLAEVSAADIDAYFAPLGDDELPLP